ncbi:MAG TPA: hypothetical protein VFE32_13340 [Puia sp.]|jgi:hypothetical protein|nr:hypothetical protein [Puia sp.]
MHNKILITLVVLITAAAAGCAKHQFLPVVTPPVSKIFTVTSLKHTADTVNIGDTVYLNAAGTIYDTSKAVYVFMTSTYTANGASTVYNFGSASSPVKVKYTTGAANNGVFGWTATIPLIGATEVPAKTKLTIAATFQYQLSLSSELPSSLSITDAGQTNKTVYVH